VKTKFENQSIIGKNINKSKLPRFMAHGVHRHMSQMNQRHSHIKHASNAR